MSTASLLSRSYDLRAIYPTEIDEDFFFRLGYAFAVYTKHSRIAIGYDARLSGKSLAQSLMAGIANAGATAIDLGLVSTDMLGFATCASSDIESGIMVTASHNPKEYNGVKSLAHSGEPYNLKMCGAEIGEIMDHMPPFASGTLTQEHIETRDIRSGFAKHIAKFLKNKDFSGMKIVADAGNGSAGVFMEMIREAMGFTLIPLFFDPDGDFPHHHPNPMMEENRRDARRELLETGADIAFIFDGDADRIMLLDEEGEVVSSGVIASIIAKKLLEQHPGATFIGNAVVSHIFRDTVESLGGAYIREKVGHVYIREHMKRDEQIIFAGEHSAHYFFRDNFCIDSGILVGMLILDMMKMEGKKLSELTREYQKYITLEETNFTVNDPKEVVTALREAFHDEEQDTLDGLTVSYPDGSWWNVRPSSNEPLLRLNLEARTQERFDELYAEVTTVILRFTQ